MPLGSPSIGNKYPGEKTITGGAFLHDMKSSQAERVDRECSSTRARGDGEPEMPSHTFNRREVPAVKLFTQAQKLNHGKCTRLGIAPTAPARQRMRNFDRYAGSVCGCVVALPRRTEAACRIRQQEVPFGFAEQQHSNRLSAAAQAGPHASLQYNATCRMEDATMQQRRHPTT